MTREAKRFFCGFCDAAFICNAELRNHNASEGHRDRAAGISKPAPGKYVATEAIKRVIGGREVPARSAAGLNSPGPGHGCIAC